MSKVVSTLNYKTIVKRYVRSGPPPVWRSFAGLKFTPFPFYLPLAPRIYHHLHSTLPQSFSTDHLVVCNKQITSGLNLSAVDLYLCANLPDLSPKEDARDGGSTHARLNGMSSEILALRKPDNKVHGASRTTRTTRLAVFFSHVEISSVGSRPRDVSLVINECWISLWASMKDHSSRSTQIFADATP